MNKTLVVGIETVVGANIAAKLAEDQCVVGVTGTRGVSIDGIEQFSLPAGADAIQQFLVDHAPDEVVYCGPAACSAWVANCGDAISDGTVEAAAVWSAAAREAAAGFTMISSDAVFTGPWMFHDEESLALCQSREAVLIRETEQRVAQACPSALIVRTNAFGWSPLGERGWLERLISGIENHQVLDCDFISHATPILATDLADILSRAWDEGLQGVYHITGAERISPLQFAQRLADHFELPWLTLRDEETLSERPTGFGAGETSLQTKTIRKALCVAMPMLSEGLGRLRAQQIDGFRDRLTPANVPKIQKVA